MRKLNFLLLVFIFNIFCSHAVGEGSARLHGDYGDNISKKFYVGIYRGNGFQLVDSVMISGSGTLDVSLKDDWRGIVIVACGDYEPSWREAFRNANPETSLQFVFDGQDIEYKTSWRNQSYHSYLKYGKGCGATVALKELNIRFNALQERMYYIEKLMEKTSESAKFYTSLQREFSDAAKRFNVFCDSTSNNFSGRQFMQLYCRMFKQVTPPPGLQPAQRPAWTAAHLFDYCDLQNPQTANIPLLKDKIRHYLYLSMPMGIASTDAIERSQKDAQERLQARCNFTLPALRSEEELLRQQIFEADMEELYGTPGYHDTVNSWLPLYNPGSGRFQGMFAEDMLGVLDKVSNPEIFTGFSNDLLTICAQLGWDADGAIVAKYLSENAARLKNPAGIIQRAISSNRLQPGMPVPPLVGVGFDRTDSRELIIFYESGCDHCNRIMEELTRDYEKYKAKNIRVITVAADSDVNVYKYYADKFPWPDKLCDFRGYGGENFKNYGIMGTPSIYVVDENGVLKGMYSGLQETGLMN